MSPLHLGLFVFGLCILCSIAFIAGSFFGYQQGQDERDDLNDLLLRAQAEGDARAGRIPTDPETGEHTHFNGLETTRRATPPGSKPARRETDRKAV